MKEPRSRRVVITACGTILPAGQSLTEIAATFAEERNLFCASSIDAEVSTCPVRNFDLKHYTGRFKNSRYLNRGQQLTLATAISALHEASIPRESLLQCGLFLGSGPNLEARPTHDKALWLLDFLPNTLAAVIAQATGIQGENSTVVTACAASTQAIGQAFFAIRHGLCDIALAGGGDSRLSKPAIQAYKSAGVLATGPVESACKPFDTKRTGFTIGEGAAMFVLESLEHAQSRNAHILAEILGSGSRLDGQGMTKPDPQGSSAEQAVRSALTDHDADMVLAHGTGTLQNDAMEAALIARVHLRAKGIIAFKSWIGHLAAGCGAAELSLGLACCKAGMFPKIRNLEEPCTHDVPFLLAPHHCTPDNLVLHSFGFGGQNAALVLRPW